MLKHLILTRYPAALEDRCFLQDASELTRLSSLMVHGRTVLTDEKLRTAVAALPHLNRLLLSHCFKVCSRGCIWMRGAVRYQQGCLPQGT